MIWTDAKFCVSQNFIIGTLIVVAPGMRNLDA